MKKQTKKELHDKSITFSAIAGAVNDGVSKTGQAIKEHLVAFSGNDYENGNFYKRSLKELNKTKVNSNYLEQNIKQQSGFAAEIKSTARRNAENICNGRPERIVRTDDCGFVNDPIYDHFVTDKHGRIIPGSGEQMKFVGANPQEALKKLLSKKFQKYLDADAKITVPSDYYDGIKEEIKKELQKLSKQILKAEEDGNHSLKRKLQSRKSQLSKLSKNLKDGGVSNAEAREARLRPIKSTTKDVAKLANKAGMESAMIGAGISGGISIIKNVVGVIRKDIEIKDAAKNVAKDTCRGGVISYITGFAGSGIQAIMRNSSKACMRSLSKTNIPAAVAVYAIDLSQSMSKCIKGEISAQVLMDEVGEKGAGHLTAAICTAAGQAIIPIPFIGAMAGSMVGYLLGTSLYKEVKDILEHPNWSQVQREELKVKYNEALELMRRYEEELGALCKKDNYCCRIITEFLNQVKTQEI